MEVNNKNRKEWKNGSALYIHTYIFLYTTLMDVNSAALHTQNPKVPSGHGLHFSLFLTLEEEEEQPGSFLLFCVGLNWCGGSLFCEVENGIVLKLSTQCLCLSNAKWVKRVFCSTKKFLKNSWPVKLFCLVLFGLQKQLFRC